MGPQFLVNSANFCFLCFEEVPVNNCNIDQNNFNGASPASSPVKMALANQIRERREMAMAASITKVFNYLKSDLTGISSLSEKLVASVINKTDIRVCLCKKCDKMIELFSELYLEMERIRVEMGRSVELIYGTVATSMGKPMLTKLYRQKMKENRQAKKHCKIVEELRNEVMIRSQGELVQQQMLPTVEITSVDPVISQDERVNGKEMLLKPSLISRQLFKEDQEPYRYPQQSSSNGIYIEVTKEEEISLDKDLSSLSSTLHPISDTLAEPEPTEIEKLMTQVVPGSSSSVTEENGHETQKKRRIRKQIGKTDFTCKICFKTFTNKQGLRAHENRHSGVKPYVCQICEMAFSDRSNLRVHMKRHFGITPHVCSICKQGFARRLELVRHTRNVHKAYSLSELLARKEKIAPIHFDLNAVYMGMGGACNNPQSGITIKCQACSRYFSSKKALDAHKKTHNEVEVVHACQVCNKTYRSKFNLKTHLQRHLEHKPWPCDVCKAAFFTKGELIEHKWCAHKVKVVNGNGRRGQK